MQYQVFVQNLANNGYIAAVIGLPGCLAEGHTKEEAIANAKTALQSRLAQGEIVTIDVEESLRTSRRQSIFQVQLARSVRKQHPQKAARLIVAEEFGGNSR